MAESDVVPEPARRPDPQATPGAAQESARGSAPVARRRSRDRRGRGMRGPGVLPARLGTPALRTRRERFDALVVGVVGAIDARWQDRLGLVEYAVEDAPQLPDDWDNEVVPLASLVRAGGGRPARLVVFRRPIEHRCETREDLEALVLTVVVEQVAELLGVDPGEVDPRYRAD
ncbi:metallopeptidase family protein [Nocardioides sp. TRM66260-LWL]|uniref:metallopeptidase family protein n=1 Tax=Nocardioides sp. TRM66260-LWL TaxID=2874478 RepID=UPI001CC783D9|nr:metallopeptidase family protein [Nocardioides sp. TRM66260-LWL]MBZ5734211.1 metallopeptidase family protein [Nocardioides sp. TRM66260-LWL]